MAPTFDDRTKRAVVFSVLFLRSLKNWLILSPGQRKKAANSSVRRLSGFYMLLICPVKIFLDLLGLTALHLELWIFNADL